MMNEQFARLCECIMARKGLVVDIQRDLTATVAIGPENGGDGEISKAALVEGWLSAWGVPELIRVDSPDARVACGYRPNLIARFGGKNKRMLWLFAHLDVVPAGDPGLWNSDPWKLRHEGDIIYGRGVEDNQQAITSMLLLAHCILEQKLLPHMGLGLVFMADEECGSRHGLSFILDNYAELFSKDDFFIVPDGGSRNASYVEIAEKAQLWLKFVVTGKQCHASTPQKGINAFVAASDLVLALGSLNYFFPDKNSLFRPPYSTFVPTRHLENVQGINIIPGIDIFYMDCRLLPEVSHEDVLRRIEVICASVAQRHKVKIDCTVEQFQKSSAVSAECCIMPALAKAVEDVYGVTVVPVGIGGATVAAMLRARDLDAVVWSCIQNTCHQPDEMSSITATCKDAMVFAHILCDAQPLECAD